VAVKALLTEDKGMEDGADTATADTRAERRGPPAAQRLT